ncbi:MAG: urea carboxylase-associated family protein [Pseudomonadota bacterium]
MSDHAVTLEAGGVCSIALEPGERVRIINVPGDQVIDTWAFATEAFATEAIATGADAGDTPIEHMSMEHSRAWWLKLRPTVGDVLVTNRHNALLRLEADTSPGIHDTLIAACNPDRYRVLGAGDDHANCENNLHSELARHGIATDVTPCPLNLFMNIPSRGENGLAREAPEKSPNCYVEFSALQPARVVFSACPMDVLPINGTDGPKDGVRIERV